MPHTKPNYLFTEDEQRQKKQIEALFNKFDGDGSGALDAKELLELYNQNNVPVTLQHIMEMYGKDVRFTPERFINITKNKQDLQRYFRSFKKIKRQMINKADGERTYMPTTFDETMVEFGQSLERKRLID